MLKFFVGVLVGACLVPSLVVLYVRLGYAPVATMASPLPLERRLARMALHARMAKEMPVQVPMPVTEANLTEGAKVYREQCAACHGLMGRPETGIAKGMFPHPPHLFQGKGVTDDPPGETYWKTSNGIRLTGMPSFMGTLTDDQLWQVSLLLANADKLPAPVKALVSQPAAAK